MKHSKLILATLAAATIGAFADAHAGDVVVIVNKGNDSADKATIVKVYSGEAKTWSNGDAVAAFDLPEDNPSRAAFAGEVMGKNLSNMKALWAQNVFTGKAVPPKKLASDDEVKKAVAASKGAVGYIKAGSADDTVKVISH
jgi:ABC-type phosphate transport system substrate-binding protein